MSFPIAGPAPNYPRSQIAALLRQASTKLVREPGSILVQPSGDGSSGVFMFGENPGLIDARNGKSFTGPFSQSFNDSLLPSTGLTRENIYLSNLVKCNLPDNREPTPQELMEWSPIILVELLSLQPRLVVAMGKFAAGFFLGDIKITKLHGQVFQVQLYQNYCIDLLVTLHPASAYHNLALMENVKSDFMKIKAYLAGELTAQPLQAIQPRKVVPTTASEVLF